MLREREDAMNESIRQLLPDVARTPVVPQWSVIPREDERPPEGRLPFDILFLPETPRLIERENIFFNNEGQPRRTDNPTLETAIEAAKELRRQTVESFNARLRQELEAQGVPEDEIAPQLRKFFDGRLARLHPSGVVASNDSVGLRLGETTYFTYAGSRRRENLVHGYDRLALPLAVCSVITAPSEDGTTKILYTVRGTANETYPGWFHTVGGTVQTMEHGIANPTRAIGREITEELGLQDTEYNLSGAMGIMMNTFDLHPELVYRADSTIPVEKWHGKRASDKEVDVHFFTDTPENLEAFILGQKTAELPDARPIVPSGLFGYLVYGRLKYGQRWYNTMLEKLPQY